MVKTKLSNKSKIMRGIKLSLLTTLVTSTILSSAYAEKDTEVNSVNATLPSEEVDDLKKLFNLKKSYSNESLDSLLNQRCTDLNSEKSELVRMLVVKDQVQYDRLFLYNLIARHKFKVGAPDIVTLENYRDLKEYKKYSSLPETTADWIHLDAISSFLKSKSVDLKQQDQLELYAVTAQDLRTEINKIQECNDGLRFISRFANMIKSMQAILKVTNYLTKMKGLDYLTLGIDGYQSVVKKHEELIKDPKSIEDKAYIIRNTIEDLQRVTSEFEIEEHKLNFQFALQKGHMDYTNSAAELGCNIIIPKDKGSVINEYIIISENIPDRLKPRDFLDKYPCLKKNFSFIKLNRENYKTTCYPVIDSFFRQQTMCKE